MSKPPATPTHSISPAASVEFRSAKTRSEWKAIGEGADDDDVKQLRSFISGMMTDENLIVMTGLGTSLCVTDSLFGDRLAPTMGDLWKEAEQAWMGDINLLCEQIHYDAPVDKRDFEELMSRCNLALQFWDDATLRTFVQDLEKRVVKRCRFKCSL